MKTMRYFLALSFVVFITSCSTTFRPWKLSEVQEGMDRTQVIKILGEPDSTMTKDGAEHLRYAYREEYNPSLSPDSVIAADADNTLLQQNMDIKEYTYEVILVDGKVINYKEIKD